MLIAKVLIAKIHWPRFLRFSIFVVLIHTPPPSGPRNIRLNFLNISRCHCIMHKLHWKSSFKRQFFLHCRCPFPPQLYGKSICLPDFILFGLWYIPSPTFLAMELFDLRNVSSHSCLALQACCINWFFARWINVSLRRKTSWNWCRWITGLNCQFLLI